MPTKNISKIIQYKKAPQVQPTFLSGSMKYFTILLKSAACVFPVTNSHSHLKIFSGGSDQCSFPVSWIITLRCGCHGNEWDFLNLERNKILNSVWFRGIFYVCWGAAPWRLRRECGVRRRKRGWLAVPQYIVRVLHVREGLGRSLTSFSRALAAAPQSSHSQQLGRLRPSAPPATDCNSPSKSISKWF